jgi:hypothetical protein
MLRDRYVLEQIAARCEDCRIDPRAFSRVGKSSKLRLGRSVTIGAFTVLSVEPGRVLPTVTSPSLRLVTLLTLRKPTIFGRQAESVLVQNV